MKICIDLSDSETKILEIARLDEQPEVYLKRILHKNFFKNFNIELEQSYIAPEIEYYSDIDRLTSFLGIKQQEIADYLNISQSTFAKAMKTQSRGSIVYEKMVAIGSSREFITKAYEDILYAYIDNSDEFLSEFMEICDELEDSYRDRREYEEFLKFIRLLQGFFIRKQGEKYSTWFLSAFRKYNEKFLLIFQSIEENSIENRHICINRCYALLKEYPYL